MECIEYGRPILYQISYHYIYHLLEGEGTIFNNKNVIALVRAEKGQHVD
jgi:hypothetical protein